jgi:plastocyanin
MCHDMWGVDVQASILQGGVIVAGNRGRGLAAAALLVLAAGGCGGGTGGSSAAATPTGQTETVLAVDNSFKPQDVTVAAGTTVRWENRGRNGHNIIPVDADQSWRVEVADFKPDATAEHTFTEPGAYRYYCSVHGNATVGMTGVITVE